MAKADKKNKEENSEKSFAHAHFSWYPGHMAKTRREIEEDLKLIDVVVEILDSRIPISSRNPDIQKITENKDRVIVLNKSDLSDKVENEKWVKFFKSKDQIAILADCNSGQGVNEIIRTIEKSQEHKKNKYDEKGRIGRIIKAMVLRHSKCWKVIFY